MTKRFRRPVGHRWLQKYLTIILKIMRNTNVIYGQNAFFSNIGATCNPFGGGSLNKHKHNQNYSE